MPNKAKDHSDSRKSVCFLCLQKCDRTLSLFVQQRITHIFKQEFNFDDDRIPQGICNGCRSSLQRIDQGSESNKSVPKLFDFTSITLKPITRGSEICECLICRIAKLKLNEVHPLAHKEGASCETGKAVISPSTSEKLCGNCLSVIGRGLSHKCSQVTKLDNIKKILETDDKIKERGQASTSSSHQNVAASMPTSTLSASDLVQVQVNTGLSNKKMRQLASTLNEASGGQLVKPNFRDDFASLGKQLKDYFLVSELDLQGSTKKIVHCKNLKDLVETVLERRNLSRDDVLIKMGIDGVGSFLKFSISVVKIGDRSPTSPKRPKGSMSLMSTSSLDTGVKKQIIIAIAENVSETYENIKTILGLINPHNVDFIVSCDMKMANILCGIQSHSSKHPCCWCNISSDNLSNQGSERTFNTIIQHFEKFMEEKGGSLKFAKEYENAVHIPLLDEPTQGGKVIERIPPMELHLLLGIVNHMFKGLIKCWPDGEFWPQRLHIKIEKYHGGEFVGNDCLKLLKNINILEEMLDNATTWDRKEEALSFVKAFKDFKKVVRACFGILKAEDFKESLSKFKSSYMTLGISITPKVHAVFYHIEEFLENKRFGLGIYSEQSTESLHSKFSVHWSRYKRNLSHPKYGDYLLSCIVDFNSKHL